MAEMDGKEHWCFKGKTSYSPSAENPATGVLRPTCVCFWQKALTLVVKLKSVPTPGILYLWVRNLLNWLMKQNLSFA